MTIEHKMKDSLVAKGLFADQADQVLSNVKQVLPLIGRRWEDDVEGYSPVLLSSIMLAVDREALAWIDANQPKHWARALFVA